ncbi:MAG: type III pantothenate kinase [Oscillospiraceae bacterium]|nr:type III pantothenate kinase [Oscillospiraceae bacterium]
MLLAIDIGNSNVVIGCLNDKNETVSLFRMVTDLKKTEDEYAAGMQAILAHNNIDTAAFEGAIICSVVPPLTEIFRTAVKKITGCHALVVGAGIKTGLNILIDDPSSLGSDLAAAAVAAMVQFPQPVIVIDMGTATTLTVIDEGNRFIGGAIVPGVALSMNALSGGTSLLHKVPIEAPKKCISGTTTACMQSGAVYGNAALLDGMIDRFEAELGKKTTVVATGGIAPKVVPHCRHEIIYDEDLLLKGLGIIYRKNVKK